MSFEARTSYMCLVGPRDRGLGSEKFRSRRVRPLAKEAARFTRSTRQQLRVRVSHSARTGHVTARAFISVPFTGENRDRRLCEISVVDNRRAAAEQEAIVLSRDRGRGGRDRSSESRRSIHIHIRKLRPHRCWPKRSARILHGLYRIAPIVFILPIVLASRRNRGGRPSAHWRIRHEVCIYTHTYTAHTNIRARDTHVCIPSSHSGGARIGCVTQPADLRRSNYSDPHITCVPTVVGGRIGRICRGSRAARCSSFTVILT